AGIAFDVKANMDFRDPDKLVTLCGDGKISKEKANSQLNKIYYGQSNISALGNYLDVSRTWDDQGMLSMGLSENPDMSRPNGMAWQSIVQQLQIEIDYRMSYPLEQGRAVEVPSTIEGESNHKVLNPDVGVQNAGMIENYQVNKISTLQKISNFLNHTTSWRDYFNNKLRAKYLNQ
ncbi:hypothetical protein, partial [Cysteiniphilum halobium]|uniref:hypothetical protein n=1 Tax=Cysteiniphilum halobium TaxID=2219059 RepID=UPI0013C33F57